jgi:hypothetical protein
MNTPTTHQDWLADVQEAYISASQRFLKGTSAISSVHELFKLAAVIAAQRRGIEDSDLIERMQRHVVQQVETDIINGGQYADYKFHFVISYIHAHTPAGILEELTADEIMEYVNSEWDLFDIDT